MNQAILLKVLAIILDPYHSSTLEINKETLEFDKEFKSWLS